MNFFGKNESNAESIKNFDSFDKIVWSRATNYSYPNKISNFEIINNIKNLSYLKHVHHNDKWELYSFICIESDKVEYAGNFLVVPEFMYAKYQEHLKKLCCGIFSSFYKTTSGRSYIVLFDYGH